VPTEHDLIEDVRARLLIALMSGDWTGDLEPVQVAFRHIETMAKIKQLARGDELKPGEAGMENRTARDIAQMQVGGSELNGSARSPEAVSASIGDALARIHAQEAEDAEKAAEEDGESAS